MCSFTVIIVTCIILISAFFLYRWYYSENFRVVDAENGDIILYYSPNCGHCHAFMNTWDKFSDNAVKLKIRASKIDCSDAKCDGISGYPTVILHKRDGTNITFNGKRTVDELESFVSHNI